MESRPVDPNNPPNVYRWKGPTGVEFEQRRSPVTGTYYYSKTPREVVDVLDRAHGSKARVRIYCGDVATGKAWSEEWHTIGTVGRSTGWLKVPLLVPSGSTGGSAILDACIVAIQASPHVCLYRHPSLDLGQWTASAETHTANRTTYQGAAYRDGELYARCRTLEKARTLCEFMEGKRWAK